MTTTTPDYSWIDNDPAEEEIDQNEDGSQFIPIGIIEKKLTKLDPFWSSNNLQFQIEEITSLWEERCILNDFIYFDFPQEKNSEEIKKCVLMFKEKIKKILDNPKRIILVDGSIEITVSYGGRTRTLVGAATIPINIDAQEGNFNFRAVIKAEATKNAVKGISANFGANLNNRGDYVPLIQKNPVKGKQKPPAVKMKPDAKIQEQFNRAYEEKNGLAIALTEIYDIQYTGDKIVENAQS